MTDRPYEQAILEESYDEVPYQSYPFNQTHPIHLFTFAKLLGLNPPPVETARILEIGCSSGGNIIPMACHFPNAKLVGFDLSKVEISKGLEQITDLKLTNIELRHQSILDFNQDEGQFDYIICHGVYSWVDAAIRDKILQIYRDNLAKNGIGYISYNTYPGWNMVNILRDLMIWRTQKTQNQWIKIKQGRSTLKFFADGLKEDHTPYAEFFRGETELLSKQMDSYIAHEHLSYYNEPCYFYEFNAELAKHNLAYLGDAFLANMYIDILPAHFSQHLTETEDFVEIEQTIDFIRNQRFRCSLICHPGPKIDRTPKNKKIDDFYLQYVADNDKPNLSFDDIGKVGEINFYNALSNLKVRNPTSQLAMLILMEEKAKPLHFNDLCQKIVERSSFNNIAAVKHHLNDDLNLMLAAFAGLINLSSYPGDFTLAIANKPIACKLSRYQAQKDNYVTNRLHQTVALDAVAKTILPFLDGKHEIQDLAHIARSQLDVDALNLLDEDKHLLTDEDLIKQRVEQACREALEIIAKQALLINP